MIEDADASVAIDLVSFEREVDFFDAVTLGARAEPGFRTRRTAAAGTARSTSSIGSAPTNAPSSKSTWRAWSVPGAPSLASLGRSMCLS